jgi:antirestriction protein ArdC
MTAKQHTNGSRTDLYTRITGKIIADLEQGVRPGHKPWNAAHLERRIARPLRHNGIPYQGINTVMLWMSADACGFKSAFWLTFRQALDLGGNVRKGEHGELVVYAHRIVRRDTEFDRRRHDRGAAISGPFQARRCGRSSASRSYDRRPG